MDNKYLPDDLYRKQYDDCLTEIDFYPPADIRTWGSYVEDIDGGDNFADYCEYIFTIYEEEGYYEG